MMNKTKTISGNLKYILLALTISSCSHFSNKNTQPTSWNANHDVVGDFYNEGKFSLKDENNKGYSASFDWLKQNNVQIINIKTPLGNIVGKLCQDENGVVMQDSAGKIFQAASTVELSKQFNTPPIPLENLYFWANGRYNPNMQYNILPDDTLIQQSWNIKRQVSDKNTQLNLNRENLSIKLIFRDFKNIPEQFNLIECPKESN